MELLQTKDLSKISNKRLGGEIFAKLLMQFLRFGKIKKIFNENSDKVGIEFIEALLETLDLKYEVFDNELNHIPKEGPFITISNHPFGGLDGLLLLKMISDIRPDYKLLGNFLLQRIEPLEDMIISQSGDGAPAGDSFVDSAGIKAMQAHLKQGKPVGIFPAMDVASLNPEKNRASDKVWNDQIIRFAKKAGVPIVPIYFKGSNSKLFHLLSKIHPMLIAVKLPSEISNKKKKSVYVRIGSAVSVKEQEEFTDIDQFRRYLRAKTYSLGTSLPIKKFFKQTLMPRVKKVEPIAEPIARELIEQEIENVQADCLLFSTGSFQVICAASIEIPNTLKEIGRLREITFREVGEGTNRSLDLDEYDLYYHQLIIWDAAEKKIVGAYRVGKGKEIIDTYGKNGFYIKSLFKIKNEFTPILEQSFELGRSFVVQEYQRKPLSLFLLWKGILYLLLKNPEYRYLIGPVSISNEFSKFSKSLIVDFIKSNFYNQEFAKYIKPRKHFKVRGKYYFDRDVILNNSTLDFKKLDSFIKDIEVGNLTTPVLLKKYIKLNAKIIGFNIDPKFNDCLDGLIILDIFDVPIDTIKSLSKELNDSTLLDRFNF